MAGSTTVRVDSIKRAEQSEQAQTSNQPNHVVTTMAQVHACTANHADGIDDSHLFGQ